MSLAAPGYLRPRQTRPIGARADAMIRQVCPGLRLTQDPAGRVDHPLWGPVIAMRAGHATDPALRQNASSGGMLSAILVHLLETGAVDGVLQTAANPDLPVGNRTVVSGTPDDVFVAAGSRYAPSAPLADLSTHLVSKKRLAFVGKPCDVAALQAMKRFEPRIAECFPYVISFFCAGVPSLSGARAILAQLGVAEGEVTAFRYRGNGWPGFATATLADGTTRRMSYSDSWGGVLSKHVQLRCKICPDGTGGAADIVCADAWETDAKGYPVFAEREGVSLVVSRTERGEAVVREALAACAISAAPFDMTHLERIQPGQAGRRRLTLARLVALWLLGRPIPAFGGFHLLRNAVRAGLLANARNLLGTLRRTAQGRL